MTNSEFELPTPSTPREAADQHAELVKDAITKKEHFEGAQFVRDHAQPNPNSNIWNEDTPTLASIADDHEKWSRESTAAVKRYAEKNIGTLHKAALLNAEYDGVEINTGDDIKVAESVKVIDEKEKAA